jgi:hypothetical protein
MHELVGGDRVETLAPDGDAEVEDEQAERHPGDPLLVA